MFALTKLCHGNFIFFFQNFSGDYAPIPSLKMVMPVKKLGQDIVVEEEFNSFFVLVGKSKNTKI